MVKARLIATGSYLPQRILTNQELEQMVDTSDEWIVSRTGMKERRLAGEGEYASHMGAMAAKKALESIHLDPCQIDLILVATMTPDHLTPSTSAIIQAMIGCTQAGAMDLSAACSGFIYALATAKAYVESGLAKHVLVIATEKLSSFVDWQDRKTCVLFGDGAGAAIVAADGAGWELNGLVLGADGREGNLFKIPAGGSSEPASQETIEKRRHFMMMDGKEVFKHAVRRMVQAAEQTLAATGCNKKDLDFVVCHQANLRILEAVAQRMELDESKLHVTLHKYGNTSAATIAIALDELCIEYKEQPPKRVLLLAFGAGLTWGSALLDWIEPR